MHRRNIFKRIFRIYSIVSSILFVASIVLIYFLIKDNNRSSFVDKDITINEIIDKNFVEGFQNTNNDGVFSFSLSEEDINTFLNESYKTLNSKNIKSFYYENKDDHHYFCFDIKTIVFKSRLVIDTVASLDESDYSISLKIVTTKVGKFDFTKILKKKGFLSKSNLDALFINASLPIRYVEESNSLIVKPLEFISLFPDFHVGKNIFNYALSNPDGLISLDPNVIGFKVDFTSLHKSERSEYVPSPKVDIKSELSSALESLDIGSMSSGTQKVAYSLSCDKLSDLINDDEDIDYKYVVNSTLVSKSASFDVVVESSVTSSETILFKVFYDLNGHVISDSFSASLFENTPSNYYNFYFEFGVTSNSYQNMLYDDLATLLCNTNSGIFIYNELNHMIEVNLKSMNDALPPGPLKSSTKSISLNNESNTLDFLITKI